MSRKGIEPSRQEKDALIETFANKMSGAHQRLLSMNKIFELDNVKKLKSIYNRVDMEGREEKEEKEPRDLDTISRVNTIA